MAAIMLALIIGGILDTHGYVNKCLGGTHISFFSRKNYFLQNFTIMTCHWIKSAGMENSEFEEGH